ncbi:Vi polysaccharide biosynthesis UDP-N-acetylglucosamine C-6 dehydrogenase TviB [Amylibacter sp. IMCC11727]|uniref:Vi polysaccharide biosynthesis UDP-N-acetylglucosamine C-6 dehydrogenase TviB n=1 Tax=Amylibacter sp. IMCC11727 TaxID=3039851 RepID=UPI00244E0ED6|nr:Vi polysaccharide biosynthesis UDP-N-acetylglucosamine C-6 dehydrogenase TviB [Amylibacter sp. IMCC11727]WGI22254.1 Vi polysaccharide biosynthesis UDP-N-acetylglucosamine C-6 dehydrogenase TviB [Amylibacter sp. IMCC11727]
MCKASLEPVVLTLKDAKIAVIGLGYVGLPLAVEFGKQFPTVGFDVNASRINELRDGVDVTREVTAAEIAAADQVSFTAELDDIRDCNVYVVTVPTPVDDYKTPDLSPLLAASETVGQVISAGDVVIFESTVYPGATEEDCVPVIEAVSGLTYNADFWAGYSPERINPGDMERRLPSIVKVTSGSTPQAADFVDALYTAIVTAGTHKAPSIAVAEAAKVIENTQRDLNIALVNELALIFHRLGIDTADVLAAAGTKWNFLPFKPGLVGGHCIGVDPYYLTHKAQAVGYNPEVILAGRRINDDMGKVVASELIKAMIRKSAPIQGADVLVMGLTFKENCPDLRNTKVVDVIAELKEYGINVHVTDPNADPAEAKAIYGIDLLKTPEQGAYDAVVLAVAHDDFAKDDPAKIQALCKDPSVIYDLKHVLPKEMSDLRL